MGSLGLKELQQRDFETLRLWRSLDVEASMRCMAFGSSEVDPMDPTFSESDLEQDCCSKQGGLEACHLMHGAVLQGI